MKRRDGFRLLRCETGVEEAFDSALVHGVEEVAEGFVAAGDALLVGAAGGEHREGVLNGGGDAADAGEGGGAAADGVLEAAVERGIVREGVADVDQAEVDVARLVVA